MGGGSDAVYLCLTTPVSLQHTSQFWEDVGESCLRISLLPVTAAGSSLQTTDGLSIYLSES